MLPYINHSESALQLELKNLTRIKQLVKEMEKPSCPVFSSTIVFHSPQASHFPCHLGYTEPQFWQIYCLLSFLAKAIPPLLSAPENNHL